MKTPLLVKKTLHILLVIMLSFTQISCDNQIDDFFEGIGDDDTECDEDTTTVSFKQVAYWSDNDDDSLDDIDFSMLTHIIYNKIAVSSDGSLTIPDEDDLEDMVEYAQDAGVYAMASIGNSSDSAFNSIAADDDALDNFRDNVEDLIDEYGLDGIDINWQFPEDDDEGDLFEDLIKEMDDMADDEGVLLSYVVDTGEDDDATDDGVQDDTLEYGDFINVMAVDMTDTDDPTDEFEDAIAYWTDRCVVKNRLVVVIPAYSDGDGELDFREIVEDDADNACYDEASNVEDEDGNEYDDIYYNGIPTVTDKTEYAQNYAGGVVISSLEQDYLDSDYYSILATIDWQVQDAPNDICD